MPVPRAGRGLLQAKQWHSPSFLLILGGKPVLSRSATMSLRVHLFPRRQVHSVGEDVLVMDDPIQRERVNVARIRPDGMRFLPLVYDQSAVVTVEARLVAVWWWEDR